ncbi:MAG: hypothetical protein PHQ62_02505 [Clostridia bacterium]|nr:hypothetical protein [Clostridia bacterium]
MNNNFEFLITTETIAEKIFDLLKSLEINFMVFPNCKGYTTNTNFLDFIGFAENKRVAIIFQTSEENRRVILKNILANYNKPNNGIMFTILGDDEMETENKMFVAIINAGQGEKVADIIRKECQSGVTIFDARGGGADFNEFMGMQINSNKEIVFSVMRNEFIAKIKKVLKDQFNDANTDLVTFAINVNDFNKLHN